MNRSRFRQLLPFLFAFLVVGVVAFAPHVFAQSDSLETVGTASGLGSEDPRIIVAKIIRVVLSVLGVLAVLIVLYGGFTWMTAGGSEEKVEKAKKILVRGAIGLTIILLSWSITTFVIGALLNATGSGGGTGSDGTGGSVPPGGTTTSFTVTDYSPDADVAIRNVQLQVTFSRALDATTVPGNIVVTNAASGVAVDGTLTVSGSRATFKPTAACPSPNEDRFCFDADAEFTVTVSEDIKSSSGTTLVCTGDRCSSSFGTGSLVDTEDPVAKMTDPESGDGVEAGGAESVQVHATDDSEIASADFIQGETTFDSVGATGADLSDVTLDSLWDTTLITVGNHYGLSVVVTDIAGNTDTAAVRVLARGAWCFNTAIDTDHGETGLNCGGDATSVDYCGACSGSTCVDDEGCSSGSCIEGICSDVPSIESYSPENGAPGTYVTITGSGFGSRTGVVTFPSVTGDIVASMPPCTDGWSDTEIVVEVPEGAIDGPITVTTANSLAETTNDDEGPLLDDYVVNDTVRPKLCTLSKQSAEATSSLTLSGFDFGDSQNDSTVAFTASPAGSYTKWADSSLSVTVPSVTDGAYDVSVTVNGVASNILHFTVAANLAAPVIAALDPNSGVIGDYVTITGINFGNSTGVVRFTNNDSGYSAVGSVAFPAACADDYWADQAITIIVPATFSNDVPLTTGSYAVTVTTQGGAVSDPVAFTVNDGEPGPGICAVTPSSAAVGDTVTVYGERLTATAGTVTFFDQVAATLTGSGWTSTAVSVLVPSGAATGPLSLTVGATQTNSIDFALTGESGTTTETPPAAYGWYFSTGEIPVTPEIVVDCTDTTISAVPNELFTDDVCLQAVVYAEFTTVMNEGTLDDAFTIEECTAGGDQPCDTLKNVTSEGVFTTASSMRRSSFTWTPNTLGAGATYRVTVSTAATSALGEPMASGVSWDFATSADSEACEVNNVYVSPSSSVITDQYDTEEFHALPSDGCVVVDGSSYTWDWAVDEGIAGLTSDSTCTGDATSCTLVQANAEGITDVTAEETVSAVSGASELTIAFTDPYVTQYWPSCTEACSNGAIGASFNTAIDATNLGSAGVVTLYTCTNELCAVGAGDEYPSYSVSGTDCSTTAPAECTGVTIVPATALIEGTYYRVVVGSAIESVSGVPLTRTNYNGGYSWTFRVKDGDAVCTLDRLSLSPDAAIADEIGDRSTFEVEPYGSPDACSVAGQLLTSADYDWSYSAWSDDGASSLIDVAEWWYDGVVDTDLSDVPTGCTALCLPAGSEDHVAVCGDDSVGVGEECEDGNTLDGDGCSSSCLREGGATCSLICSSSGASCSTDSDCPDVGATCGLYGTSCCGNGTLEGDEECDDGDVTSGNGCSSSCLDEGSRSINATCGNSDVAFDEAIGGEDCDDGNVTNGDGCSSICLNEGTLSSEDFGGAICGDGAITQPYETCDDSNIANGDGCSSICLREGQAGSFGDCGDGETERATIPPTSAGEDCDGEEWCNDDCTYGGSSTSYSTPSFCGDGIAGLGEHPICEASGGGDAHRDALQLAEISADAAQEVNITTNQAVASMTVSEATSGLTTSATYTLSCSATNDLDCTDPETVGLGSANCCMARPTATLYPNGAEECRNAAIYGVFSEQMDLGSFTSESTDDDGTTTSTDQMYLVLDTTTVGGECPEGHTTMALIIDQPIMARAWSYVRNLFGAWNARAAAATGECVVPVTSYEQTAITVEGVPTGQYKVNLHYGTALAANATYALYVATDDDFTDTARDGVHSANDVAMFDATGSVYQKFTTGADICTLDAVTVTDTDESADYFSSTGETHDFTATSYTYSGETVAEIEPLPGVYDWDFTAWTEDSSETIVSVERDATDHSFATVEAQNANGSADVLATATITADTVNGTTGDTVVGTDSVTTFLCLAPWPNRIFPWSDDADNDELTTDNGTATEGTNGWMNFALYYCRDDGELGGDDDYPKLNVVYANDYSTTDSILKEYLFEVNDGSGDAIGVRVVSNSEYLSLQNWFDAQGFSGSPTATTVDGFEAITDGRTTYVAAPNVSGTSAYSNIYVISYNENASETAVAIYDQIINYISFAINVDETGLCVEDGSYTADTCDDDSDCSSNSCSNNRAKLTRDVKRLADMTTIGNLVTTYGATNGVCSSTVDQSCTSDDECPDSETCEAVVPTLGSGTYVRSFGASAWTSWADLLGGALGDTALVGDPLNTYNQCGNPSPSVFEDYDAATCVNQTTGSYVCPEGSYTYHYRAVGDRSVVLTADLEYTGATWINPIDSDLTDAVDISVYSPLSTAAGFTTTAFCGSTETSTTVYGSSSVCGDGIVGSSIEDRCNLTSCSDIVCSSATPAYDGESCTVDCSDVTVCLRGDADGDGYCDGTVPMPGAGLLCGSGDIDCSNPAYCRRAIISGTISGSATTLMSETCELGEAGDDVACDPDLTADGPDTDGDTVNDYTGLQARVCNNSCTDFEDDASATCVPAECGDGVVDVAAGEDCDDGELNGRYGYCGTSCTYASSFYCGDGTLAGSEVCDCGAPNGSSTVDSIPSGGTSYSCATINGNGVYNENGSQTCAWDCQGPASYCGDSVIDSGEECDTEPAAYTGKLCTDDVTECNVDADCPGSYTCQGLCTDGVTPCLTLLDCPGTLGTYMCSTNILENVACPVGNVCSGGTHDGDLCDGAGSSWNAIGILGGDEFVVDISLATRCENGGGTCDSYGQEYQTYRTRSCSDSAGTMCDWNAWGFCNANKQSCGDGVVNGDEECDDGNSDSTDGCTTSCENNICGDGYLYVGEEDCDQGTDNGGGCDANYQSSCTACSISCHYTVSSGDFCGDGVTNGHEYCDAYDVPMVYARHVDASTNIDNQASVDTNGSCTVNGETVAIELDPGDDPGVFTSFTCSPTGYCNGGSDNYYTGRGALCIDDSDCDSSDCAVTTCAADCQDTCPSTYLSDALALQTNEPGSPASSDISIYSYSSSSTSDFPNAAEVTFPECRLGASLVADISMDEVDPVDVYVVFVTSTSAAMGLDFDGAVTTGSTRLDYAKTALQNTIHSLFADVDFMQIALVSYNGDGTVLSDDATDDAPTGFVTGSDYPSLVAELAGYTAGGTSEVDDGLELATTLLDGVGTSTSRKIVVLLSEDQADSPSTTWSTAEAMKTAGYELFTVSIDFTPTMTESLTHLTPEDVSSNTTDEGIDTVTGIDYSYEADYSGVPNSLDDAYEDILNAISKISVAIVSATTSSTGVVTTTTTGALVEEGSAVTMPWPENFVCDESAEQVLPLRLYYTGEGQVEISNMRFEYCAP